MRGGSRLHTRRWGPGERLVFEPYTRDVFEQARDWIARHEIFEGGNLGQRGYAEATVRLA